MAGVELMIENTARAEKRNDMGGGDMEMKESDPKETNPPPASTANQAAVLNKTDENKEPMEPMDAMKKRHQNGAQRQGFQ